MNIKVMMSSGDEDEWADAKDAIINMDAGGALQIISPEGDIAAIYAGGMWMRVEYGND